MGHRSRWSKNYICKWYLCTVHFAIVAGILSVAVADVTKRGGVSDIPGWVEDHLPPWFPGAHHSTTSTSSSTSTSTSTSTTSTTTTTTPATTTSTSTTTTPATTTASPTSTSTTPPTTTAHHVGIPEWVEDHLPPWFPGARHPTTTSSSTSTSTPTSTTTTPTPTTTSTSTTTASATTTSTSTTTTPTPTTTTTATSSTGTTSTSTVAPTTPANHGGIPGWVEDHLPPWFPGGRHQTTTTTSTSTTTPATTTSTSATTNPAVTTTTPATTTSSTTTPTPVTTTTMSMSTTTTPDTTTIADSTPATSTSATTSPATTTSTSTTTTPTSTTSTSITSTSTSTTTPTSPTSTTSTTPSSVTTSTSTSSSSSTTTTPTTTTTSTSTSTPTSTPASTSTTTMPTTASSTTTANPAVHPTTLNPALPEQPQCLDHDGVGFCARQVTLRGTMYCFQNIVFGHYECCATCAIRLGGTARQNDPIVRQLHEDPICADHIAPDGTPYTAWCIANVVGKPSGSMYSCWNPVIEHRCVKSCKHCSFKPAETVVTRRTARRRMLLPNIPEPSIDWAAGANGLSFADAMALALPSQDATSSITTQVEKPIAAIESNVVTNSALPMIPASEKYLPVTDGTSDTKAAAVKQENAAVSAVAALPKAPAIPNPKEPGISA